MKARELKKQIAETTIEWYKLTEEAVELKNKRGGFDCDCNRPYESCDGGAPCYIIYSHDKAISFEQMMECEVAAKHWNDSQPYRRTARKAGGAKNRLNHLVNKYLRLK